VWIGAICAAVGLFLLCYKPGEGFSVGLGELLLFICSLLWTVHVMLIDHFGKKLRSLHYSWGQFAVCAALGIIFMFIFEGDRLSVDALVDAKWVLLYLGVLSSGCGYTLQVVGQKNADPTYAVIILSTESAFSAIGGAIFGIDNIPLIGYAGCVLMFGGIIFSQLEFPRRKTIGEKLVQIEETSENDET
jgi:drug/metabolite transporter (DMT)-like permease